MRPACGPDSFGLALCIKSSTTTAPKSKADKATDKELADLDVNTGQDDKAESIATHTDLDPSR